MNTHFLYKLALVACAIVVPTTFIQAQPTPVEWDQKQDVDLSAFRYVIEVPAPDIAVPTVVEVPLESGWIRNKTTVVQNSTGKVEYAAFRSTYVVPRTQILIETDPSVSNTYALTDRRYDTSASFPFVEGSTNTVTMTLQAPAGVTTSALQIALPPNVILPQTVNIKALENGGTPSVVVATRRLTSPMVRFPETTATQFIVQFALNQPLRLSEVSLVPEVESQQHNSIRFLAQPGERYKVYLDPDRAFGFLQTGGVNLNNSAGIVTLSASSFDFNPTFSLADSDEDTVPDEYDNCVSVANTNQEDLNNNGVGDVCDDFDRDGYMTNKDNCPNTPNRNQRDTDGDGIGDACDTEEDRFTERNPWVPWFGMGIASLVLVGLLFLSVRPKESQAASSEEVEPKEENQEEEASAAIHEADR